MQQDSINEAVLHFFTKKWSILEFPSVFKQVRATTKFSNNLGQNIFRDVQVSAQFVFTRIKTKLHQFHQKLNIACRRFKPPTTSSLWLSSTLYCFSDPSLLAAHFYDTKALIKDEINSKNKWWRLTLHV